MRITVLGCGYLGAVHAAAMAALGHDVLGVDVDADRVGALAAGRPPFYEPGLAELLERVTREGCLRFAVAPVSEQLARAELHFITVGTPQSDDGSADLSHVEAAVEALRGALPAGSGAVVVGKSTVPVGTASRLAESLAPRGAALVWNPEFLREGRAVEDTLHPDRIVYGLPGDPVLARRGQEALDAVYAPLLAEGVPRIVTNHPTAELVKVAANSFLATKISFINAMAEVCEATGGDVVALAEALGYDERIGAAFLRAGVGFGGGCLPKDIRAFVARAEELGVREAVSFLEQVDAINRRRRDRVVALAERCLGGSPEGARVVVLGAAFKPDSDDIRDSPALEVARRLHERGARVRVCDPRALDAVRRHHRGLETVREPLGALEDADLVLLLTEWNEFVRLDPDEAADRVATPVVIDGRNALDARRWREAGWTHLGLGRPRPVPALRTRALRRARSPRKVPR